MTTPSTTTPTASSAAEEKAPSDAKNKDDDTKEVEGDEQNDDDDDDDDEEIDIVNINVGVLGHVDSGKTSLVKALSTLLSTAALDKSHQSRQRGMTLDLGFSCFFLKQVPSQIVQHAAKLKSNSAQKGNNSSNSKKKKKKQRVQITLVDCPGHASLIRTIIGAAQIIDMVLLVVDAVKGWQAQTTECLVLAELVLPTSNSLVVALNKTDMLLPLNERPAKLEKAKKAVWERLKTTRFAQAPCVGVAACIGGEKVAAVTAGNTANEKDSAASSTAASSASSSSASNETYNLSELISVLSESLPVPKRLQQESQTTSVVSTTSSSTKDNKKDNDASSSEPPFYYSIDHCFSIRGRGTVLTGTVLSGSVQLAQVLEFPSLGRMERKVKSMQMFQRSVSHAQMGDRVGICVTSLDAKLLERGMAAQPGSVPLLHSVLALVRKVPYYTSGPLLSGSKFHISVGHTTVMATVTFWGARQLAAKQELQDCNTDGNVLPSIAYDFSQDFLQQDRLLDSLENSDGENDDDDGKTRKQQTGLLQWALLDLETPIYCPLESLVIGSRLDLAATSESSSSSTATTAPTTGELTASASATTCRLAFSGRLMTPIDESNSTADKNSSSGSGNALSRIRLYNFKERRGVISKLGDAHRRHDDGKIVRYEVFGSDLFKKETNMKVFIGMKVQVISTNTGSKHKNKKAGASQGNAAATTTTTTTTTTTVSGDPMISSPKAAHGRGGGGASGDVGEIKSSYGTDGKFRVFFPAGTEAKEGDILVLKFQRFVHDKTKAMHQSESLIKLAPARPGTRLEKEKKKKQQQQAAPALPAGVSATGEVVSVKGDVLEDDGGGGVKKHSMAIISGFFEPQVNIKEHLYDVQIPSTKEQGTIVGPFGKAGKAKVSFPKGISESAVGSKAELRINVSS